MNSHHVPMKEPKILYEPESLLHYLLCCKMCVYIHIHTHTVLYIYIYKIACIYICIIFTLGPKDMMKSQLSLL